VVIEPVGTQRWNRRAVAFATQAHATAVAPPTAQGLGAYGAGGVRAARGHRTSVARPPTPTGALVRCHASPVAVAITDPGARGLVAVTSFPPIQTRAHTSDAHTVGGTPNSASRWGQRCLRGCRRGRDRLGR
jgi:hypothetical protein